MEDHVSIGSNTTIDCATMGSTIIRAGVKIDNLVQIAHNVEIGKNTVIAAQTGISGSTKIGEQCMIAGQVGIAGHLTLANSTKVGAQSGVGKNIKKEGLSLSGSPAYDLTAHLRALAVVRNLPELEKRLTNLEKERLEPKPIVPLPDCPIFRNSCLSKQFIYPYRNERKTTDHKESGIGVGRRATHRRVGHHDFCARSCQPRL